MTVLLHCCDVAYSSIHVVSKVFGESSWMFTVLLGTDQYVTHLSDGRIQNVFTCCTEVYRHIYPKVLSKTSTKTDIINLILNATRAHCSTIRQLTQLYSYTNVDFDSNWYDLYILRSSLQH